MAIKCCEPHSFFASIQCCFYLLPTFFSIIRRFFFFKYFKDLVFD